MDANSYRRIGTIYVVVCCLVATCGAAVCLFQLMEAKPPCREFSCPNGTKNVIILAVSLKIGILSAMFAGLLKDGIDERKACAVRVNRVFVVVRTLSLIVLWTCWEIFRSNDRYEGGVDSVDVLILVLLCLVLLGITFGELLVLNGVLKYIREGSPPDCNTKRFPVYVQA